MKVAVVGGGISGVSIAKLLGEHTEVDLFEKRDRIGGLIQCDIVDGNLFHKVGGHVFNSKDDAVFKWFWDHFDQDEEFYSLKRNAKILLDGKYLEYPIENNLYKLKEEEVNNIVKELIEGNIENIGDQEVSFEEFLLNSFGKTLYEIYFKPYNEKIWDRALSSLPIEWLDGKLPMPNLHEILTNNILRKGESKMVHSTFFYPKKGGSQFIIDRLSRELKSIKTNHEVDSIAHEEDQYVIDNRRYDFIVYTGDVRRLPELMNSSIVEVPDTILNLSANGTSNLLCECDKTDVSWLYLPESKFKAHRIIYTGLFSEFNNNTGDDRITCTVEFSGKVQEDIMVNEISQLPGNLKFIASNYEPNSYIVHNNTSMNEMKELKRSLEEKNFFLLGRFAEWEYYNMDKCIESAMKIANKIIENKLDKS